MTTSQAEDSQPDWSPDGRSLVFRSERDGGGLFVASAQGGGERRLTGFGYRPRWSPDGSLVLFSSSNRAGAVSRFYVIEPGGGSPRVLRPEVLAEIGGSYIAWRPDGSAVSVLVRRRGP